MTTLNSIPPFMLDTVPIVRNTGEIFCMSINLFTYRLNQMVNEKMRIFHDQLIHNKHLMSSKDVNFFTLQSIGRALRGRK